MKFKLFFFYVITLLFFSFTSQALMLERKVEEKTRHSPNAWRVVRQDKVSIEPNVYGIPVVYGYKVRAEILWFEPKLFNEDSISGPLSLEKNDFPMDDQWDVIWTKNPFVFRLNKPFIYIGTIEDMDYKMTVTLLME